MIFDLAGQLFQFARLRKVAVHQLQVLGLLQRFVAVRGLVAVGDHVARQGGQHVLGAGISRNRGHAGERTQRSGDCRASREGGILLRGRGRDLQCLSQWPNDRIRARAMRRRYRPPAGPVPPADGPRRLRVFCPPRAPRPPAACHTPSGSPGRHTFPGTRHRPATADTLSGFASAARAKTARCSSALWAETPENGKEKISVTKIGNALTTPPSLVNHSTMSKR